MQNELQILDLIMQASWLVKGVMLLLLLASIASWVIIFRKRQALNRAEKEADAFESGFSEFLRMRQQGRMGPNAMVEGAQRSMRIALTRETEELEFRLNFLATVGSTSPYIGLFGTVWGIMTSFGFNRFSNQVERLEVRYDNFKEEFSSILQRQAHKMAEE